MEFYFKWEYISQEILVRANVLFFLWNSLKHFSNELLLFRTLTDVDKKLECLEYFTGHSRFRRYTYIAAAIIVSSVVMLHGSGSVRMFFDSPVLSYAIYFNFLHLFSILWTSLANFSLLILAVHQRVNKVKECVDDLTVRLETSTPSVSILCVLPAVESTAPQSAGNPLIRTLNKTTNELFYCLMLIKNHYSTHFAWFSIANVLFFPTFGFIYFETKKFPVFPFVIILINTMFVTLGYLCCDLLEREMRKMRVAVANKTFLMKNRNSRKQLKHLHCKLIHEDTKVSCGLFDFSWDAIPAMVNLGLTFIFAVIQK